MRPNRSTAARAASLTSSMLVTSSVTTSRSSWWPSTEATRSGVRPVATTASPASSAALAMSTPMPRPAPVTSQTFLSTM